MSLMHILRHFGPHLRVRLTRPHVFDDVPLQAVVLHSAGNQGTRRLQPLDHSLPRIVVPSPVWRAVLYQCAGTGSGTTVTRLLIFPLHNSPPPSAIAPAQPTAPGPNPPVSVVDP